MASRQPRRRCAGCGEVKPKSELVRLARQAGTGRVVLDLAGTMPGRGAYLCRGGGDRGPGQECLKLAIRRGGIARTLRCGTPPDLGDLLESMGQ